MWGLVCIVSEWVFGVLATEGACQQLPSVVVQFESTVVNFVQTLSLQQSRQPSDSCTLAT